MNIWNKYNLLANMNWIWTRAQILYEFVDAGIGVIKSAEISQNFPLVCRCQYSSEFFATSIGQVCRCQYVAPFDAQLDQKILDGI